MKTFVFTDIVRSVDLKVGMPGRSDAERDAAFVERVLTPHREHIEHSLADAGGRVVSTAGDGHFLVFDNPMLAAGWAIGVQQRHRDAPITIASGGGVEVRIGLHVGFSQTDPDDSHNFIGKAVDYAGRLTDLATGGQVLVSAAAIGLLRDAGMDGVRFHDHGQHTLRGIGEVDVHELLYDDRSPQPLRPGKESTGTADDHLPTDEMPTAPGAPRREWTVLPPTMGITEFARRQPSSGLAGGGSGGPPGGSSGSSSGAAVKPPPAEKIGNYELGELIGAGGMGNVYKARHTQFDRLRAVKIIKPHFVDAGHEEVIRRFYREIKAIGRLDHPNIVVAIDSSSPTDTTHYLVMEYVAGVSSEQLLNRRRRLSVADACEIVRQAAVGLEYIHRQGMVHRDIKPSNLMLTAAESVAAGGTGGVRQPLVKILDLGLALLASDDQQRFTRFDNRAMGTAMYMSPEQWVTTSVDIRADIYSLGCTLYHLLAGRPPFHDSDLKPQRAHERAPTPSASDHAGAPAGLDAVLAKMMAKSADERFARPADVAEAIAPFCEGTDLLGLLDAAQSGAPTPTDAGDQRETIATGRPVSDTFVPPAMPGAGSVPTPPPPASERAPLTRRLLVPGAICAAVIAVWWAGTAANQRLRKIQDERLVIAARPTADALAGEIDDRFRTLTRLSKSRDLAKLFTPINAAALPAPADPPAMPSKQDRQAWAPLQAWITTKKAEADTEFESSSWFLTDRFGRQVARHPPSEKSLGQWFAWRPYFHGGPEDLPEDAPARPITEPNQSTVYRSKTTRKLKVAFSVPVRNEDNTIIGVLGMSVELGAFRELENAKRLPEPLEVVLVDLRDGRHGRGLLLHHRELDELEDPENPFIVPAATLLQIDTRLADARRDLSPRKPILHGYADLLERADHGPFAGAVEPVILRGDDRQKPTGWLVIVQEEIGR